MKLLAYVSCIATVALAILTGVYIHYTSEIADVAKKALLLDASPKIFLRDIDFERSLDISEKQIKVKAILEITNVGKTEGLDFQCTYKMSSGKVTVEDKLPPMPYVFPTQVARYTTKIFNVSLSEEEFSAAQDAMEKKAPFFSQKKIEILLNLNLDYTDKEGEKRNIPYAIRYWFHNNKWEFMLK